MRYLDADTIHRFGDARRLAPALEAAFARPGETPPRETVRLGEAGELLMMPSISQINAGLKLVTVFPDNPQRGLPTVQGQYLLLSASTGQPRAWFDGQALTLVRTGAVSAMAAMHLRPGDIGALLIVGAGALAPYLTKAHVALRRVEQVQVWARSPARAERLAEALTGDGVPARAIADLEAAARRADIVSAATSAESPLILGDWLKPGAHLDLVGSYRPVMREADSRAIARANLVVDTEMALQDAGELVAAIADGAIAPEAVLTLTALLNGAGLDRGGDITLFKSIGTGLADLAVAESILDAAGA